MVIGLGIDLVAISRIQKWLGQERLLHRFFAPEEIEMAKRKRDMAESLAGCMAAKESFGKALGVGLFGLVLKDIRLINDPRGKPVLELHNMAHRLMQEKGGGKSQVSLAHDGDYAVAVVIIEGQYGH